MIYDYAIIGGGISGIAIARLLQMSGVRSFVILEANAEPGGLCRSRMVDGHTLDIGGGHFLCTRFKEVYDFIFHHIGRENFNEFDRVSKIDIHDQWIDYPIEGSIWQLETSLCIDFLQSIVRNGEALGLPEPETFEAWIRWKLGDKIADEYMLPYNAKIWGFEARDMDIDWLHKLPRVDVRAVLQQALTRRVDASLFPSHDRFYYPKHGGFQAVFDALCDPVRDHIALDHPVERIERSGDVLKINGNIQAREVINTAPWHALAESPIFSDGARQAIAALKSNAVVVSLHERAYDHDVHWLYQPSPDVAEHRTFFIRNYDPLSKPGGVYKETNVKRWRSTDELFAHRNDDAYPVPVLGWAKTIGTVMREAEQAGVRALGRWGQWRYFNSDVCIKEAMLLAERLGHSGWKAVC